MRILHVILALFLVVGLPANAVAADGPATRAEKLDKLFTSLARERDEQTAGRLAKDIWALWGESGSATVDLLMARAAGAMEKKKFIVALDLLDQVVMLAPGYAEGWNRRATLHYMMNNFSMSMKDIDRTLRLEPRHFGALSGMAQIFMAAGNDELALRAYERTLEIYPMMRSAQEAVDKLIDSIGGEGI